MAKSHARLIERESSPSPAEELCPHCQQWESGPDDSYCGFCGHLLIKLSVKPADVPLISGMAPQLRLVFSNTSPQPFRVKIVPAGRPLRAIVFEPAEFDVPAQRKLGVRVRLDEKALPESFTPQELEFHCQIDGDPDRSLPLKVSVKTGPRPQDTHPGVHFGRLEEGAAETRPLELWNRGGVPLSVKQIEAEGSSQLRVAEGIRFPVKVDKKQAIDVVWDTTLEETLGDLDHAGFRVGFENHPSTLFVRARADVYRRQLRIKPSEVRLEQVLSKHDHVQRMKLKNLGTVELEVVKIVSDRDWIAIAPEKAHFKLRPGDSKGFELVIHPQKLKGSSHNGRVAIFTSDKEEPEIVEVRINVLHPEAYVDYIGIDFGTTNSVIALWNQKSLDPLEVVTPNGSNSPLIPSLLLFLSSEKSFVTGFAAQREAEVVRPEMLVRSIKRVMGVRREHQFFGKRFGPEALAQLIIQQLIESAERRLLEIDGKYRGVHKAIVTVPANFFDLQIRGILEACSAAGIDTEEEQARAVLEATREELGKAVNAGIIIDEPSAAALFYLGHLEHEAATATELYRKIASEKGLHALIFDHGGGTLDVSLAHVEKLPTGKTGITVLANRGDNRVGGESIDLALMRQLLVKCRHEIDTFDDGLISAKRRELEQRRQKESWDLDTWHKILSARNQWKRDAENVKIGLSETTEAKFRIDARAILGWENKRLVPAEEGYETMLTRDDLVAVSDPILNRCGELIREALEIAQLEPKDVDYVFHTGRQSLMEAIPKRVKSIFSDLAPENDILDEKHLKVCVAKGAALYGRIKSGIASADAGIAFVDDGRRLPHSYGLEKLAGMTRIHFEEILPKGTVYPARIERHYSPDRIPANNMLNLKIYENTGTDVEISGNPDIRKIGEISIDTMEDKVPGCDVVFAIDANRRLQVLADGQKVHIEHESWEDEEGWAW